MIFVDLIYRHFDILMSQYDQMSKSHAFQGCSKMVFRLHTARTENPESPQTHPSASVCHEYHSDTPQTPIRHPPDTSQPSPVNRNIYRRRYAQTHIARHIQTAPVSVLGCLAVSVGICCRLMASWVPWRCLGGVWRMSGGCLGVSGWKSWKSEVLGFVGVYLGSQSLQYGAKTLIWSSPERHDFCSSGHTET